MSLVQVDIAPELDEKDVEVYQASCSKKLRIGAAVFVGISLAIGLYLTMSIAALVISDKYEYEPCIGIYDGISLGYIVSLLESILQLYVLESYV